ncbi:Aste57867_21715 [Aphanomyces stellatus]|uniref:Aste57867_21715 protein n=1 Tax=Aphanomyces stellatus TaxID=120398 RepID=A0A485LJL0_9STRA|nr:hypothetical protein As57867_021646 [Aphanomyces stellatus]VFT98384.1 Aste57867_21715 [Aphanomyces stellatus]
MGQSVSGPKIPECESQALRDLFAALRPPNPPPQPTRSSLPSSISDKRSEDWTGITVELGHVVGIELPKNDLSGVLPASMDQLTYLRVLNLSSNAIHGEIPASLGKLRRLTLLDLSCNHLEGALPLEIAQCIHLQHLSLQQNALDGTNSYGGVIPKCTGPLPPALGQLRRLKSLSLEYNSFSGELPPSISQLVALERLNVRSNCLGGDIPTDIGRLVHLKFLSLRNNAFRGSIPHSLGHCTALTFLNLSSNNLTGASSEQRFCTVPSSLAHLTHLKHIYLFGNAIEGEIPAQLTQIVQVQEMDFKHKMLAAGRDLSKTRHPSLVNQSNNDEELETELDKVTIHNDHDFAVS